MWLKKDTIEEFKAICREEFGAEVSDLDAHQRLVELSDLFSLLLDKRSQGTVDAADVDGSEVEPVS